MTENMISSTAPFGIFDCVATVHQRVAGAEEERRDADRQEDAQRD